VASNSSRKLRFRTPCTQLRYRCRATARRSSYSLRVTCARGKRHIRFTY
jgi:hypothetical protein